MYFTLSHEGKEENPRNYNGLRVREEKYIPYYFEPAPAVKFWNSVWGIASNQLPQRRLHNNILKSLPNPLKGQAG
jgi:hypothetical protein